jgi:hypothetical protein
VTAPAVYLKCNSKTHWQMVAVCLSTYCAASLARVGVQVGSLCRTEGWLRTSACKVQLFFIVLVQRGTLKLLQPRRLCHTLRVEGILPF